jgi:hypothetical protein
MANCSFCGEPAGYFRRKHKECQTTHDEGWSRMLALATESALGETPLEALEPRLQEFAKSSFIRTSRTTEAIVAGWELAVDHFLDDGELDESEEEHLANFQSHFSLTQEQLDHQGAYSRLVKGAILREIMNGSLPDRVHVQGDIPFNFQKTESLIWLFPETEYYEDRKRREFVGGSHGASFRIAKGVHYRVGSFRGHPVETTETVLVGTGLMGVTDRHVYFSGGGKSFRIKHDKIVTIEPYSDGVGIQRDAQTAKPQLFVTGDGWFTYNLLMNVSNV